MEDRPDALIDRIEAVIARIEEKDPDLAKVFREAYGYAVLVTVATRVTAVMALASSASYRDLRVEVR